MQIHTLLAGFLTGSLTFGILVLIGSAGTGIFAANLPRELTQRRTIVPLADLRNGRVSTSSLHAAADSNHIGVTMPELQTMLAKVIALKFDAIDGTAIDPWSIALKDHPLWIKTDDSGQGLSYVDVSQMTADIAASISKSFPTATSCTFSTTKADEQGTLRPVWKTDACMTKSGYRFDTNSLHAALLGALQAEHPTITIVLVTDQPTVTDASSLASSGQTLTLVATGWSNFKGSDPNRIANVRKAFKDKVNNIVIPPGATLSFNQMLGKVSISNGWYMGLGIFEGGELRPTPGGGVCQSSTTLYRAVLKAGLPLLAHQSHSLFVHYYEEGGVGQDVTVYSGSQDFSFTNNYASPLVIQADTKGFDANVRLFAMNDGRSVTLDGPYFAKNAPADMKVHNRAVRGNEIVWLRDIRTPDGQIAQEQLVSRYKYILHAVADKWIAVKAVADAKRQMLAEH